MVDYNDLVTKGYYYGHVKEIFSDMSIFYDFADLAKKLTETKNKNCVYINDIKGHLSSYYARNISHNKVWIRKQTIKKKKLTVSQQWWSFRLLNLINPDLYFQFKTEISNYMLSIYQHVGLSEKNIAHGDTVTLYEDGDFSEVHRDGQNKGRYAVIIMYFGQNHSDGGGEFIFGDGNVISPALGNFVMLDFTKNNLLHGVLPVKNNFKRIAYLDFIANLDMQ